MKTSLKIPNISYVKVFLNLGPAENPKSTGNGDLV